MSKDYPVSYCCSYRNGSGETVEDFLKYSNREEAFNKAKDDAKNKLWCEKVCFFDDEEIFLFTLDDWEKVSGKLEVTIKAAGITHSQHIDNFLNIPLGQIDHANHRVFLDCYNELKALWDTESTIKNVFIAMAESEYANIADFMAEHYYFNDKWAAILQNYYGEYHELDEHIMLWCQRYFGGFYRRDFSQSNMTKSLRREQQNPDETPF